MTGAFSGRIQVMCAIDDLAVGVTTSYAEGVKAAAAATMPAGIAGHLTTRTSATAGVFTADAAHTVVVGEIIALFWTGGRCYDCEVTNVGSTTITFSGAAGDALPSVGTGTDAEVVVGEAQDILNNFVVDGDLVSIMLVKVTSCTDGLVALYTAAGTGGSAPVFVSDVDNSTPYIWPKTATEALTPPFTGSSAVQIRFYNGSTTAGRMDFAALS